ncbi:competence protein ComK [Calidifontibacillus oryziterrae]|uniref:competence protein ComK n=1 Tax=Calidifontibacillus oryziterrae TaxID=1191699 RepID=UPI0002FC032F|nr:competence protein ComK [Calidifontibacillus oryziterrae]
MKSVKYSKILDEFEISPYTMAIVGEKGNKDSPVYSRILEVESEFLVKMKPMMVMDRSCKYFGSSLKGRQEGTREITGISYKAPIAVDPLNEIYMFPTISPYKDTCAWISHSYILNYFSVEREKTEVLFTNHTSIILDISKGSFENQLNRTAQFRYILSNRVHQKGNRIKNSYY